MDLTTVIRTIHDYPKPGIAFRDVSTLFGDANAFAFAIDALVTPYKDLGVDAVAGIEARGFILGGAVARSLGVGFVPVRKKGKLPHDTLSQDYALEYGVDTLEIHVDAVSSGARVLVIDDLIATGGTALATASLLRRAGAVIAGCGFVIDLPDLGGADRLRAEGMDVTHLVAFPGT